MKQASAGIKELKTKEGGEKICDFELDSCGWTQDKTDDFDWTRKKGTTGSANTGPSFDHTLGTTAGYYYYTEVSSPITQGDKARLISPTYSPSSTGECLQFWYHMYGDRMGTINVYARQNGNLGNVLWTESLDQGNVWRFGQVTMQSNIGFEAVFESLRGNGIRGDMAIDDISMIMGACPSVGYCDFESDKCGWQNEASDDDFDWMRSAGGTPSSYTGPSTDHTTATDQGFYLFIESSVGVKGNKAWLVSAHLPPTSGSCFSFWYHMYGQGVGDLNVYMKDSKTNQYIPKLSRSGNKGNVWYQATIGLITADEYQIVIEGKHGGNFTADIAIDDTNIAQGSVCTVDITTPATVPTAMPTQPSGPNDCNFENGNICAWRQDGTDDFDWRVQQGRTGSDNTGPTADHTKGNKNGYYIYLEASGKTVNEKARLISDGLTATARFTCLRFWYHMYGRHIGTLNVYANSNLNKLGQVLWTRQGEQNYDWTFGQLLVNDTANTFYIVFEGVRGDDFMGDISLDDLQVSDGECPPRTFCDFQEDDICGYTQDKTDDFDWSRGSGRTLTIQTGPRVDHTYGTSEEFLGNKDL
ncbi:MAM and LDL-receptor class A domain-containing protein 1-like [Antedon mediterranea]|uniref:MAM and LDL-receptor class A domain-containing protein 1-like n=1 Tax=Antedon mediterranea TaxID=105859 RepID=UPI003AF6B6E0